ncbi:MAG TPA: outer membrane beta-barrel protein [Terriglobia bacterium]|nr:outer membrane beta-barrel protein [Terriglobia bacterium]
MAMNHRQSSGSESAFSIWQFFIRAAVVVLVTLIPATYGIAQESEDARGVTFNFAGGASPLLGSMTTNLKNGGAFSFGAGYRFTSRFSENVQFSYYTHRVTQALLNEAQVRGGNAHTWSLTLDPKIQIFPKSRNRPYVVGGFGYYRRTVEFTQPALVSDFYLDPFFDILYTVTVPANQVLSDSTSGGIGGNLGGGFEFKLHDGPTLFTEARYHYANTGGVPTKMIPVSFGIRW